MSWINYKKAIRLLEENKDECYFVGKQSDLVLLKAEKMFGQKFSKMYEHFIRNYGAGYFGSVEVYGVKGIGKIISTNVTDAIKYTLINRSENHLPDRYLILYDKGDKEIICLDFDRLNHNKEPAVVTIYLDIDFSKQPFEFIAEDFGDYLLEHVEAEIADFNSIVEVTIDVSKIKTAQELHLLLKDKLDFPAYYGENWNAFWDCITECMPDKLLFIGWVQLENRLPKDTSILKNCLLDCKFTYSQNSEIVFN